MAGGAIRAWTASRHCFHRVPFAWKSGPGKAPRGVPQRSFPDHPVGQSGEPGLPHTLPWPPRQPSFKPSCLHLRSLSSKKCVSQPGRRRSVSPCPRRADCRVKSERRAFPFLDHSQAPWKSWRIPVPCPSERLNRNARTEQPKARTGEAFPPHLPSIASFPPKSLAFAAAHNDIRLVFPGSRDWRPSPAVPGLAAFPEFLIR